MKLRIATIIAIVVCMFWQTALAGEGSSIGTGAKTAPKFELLDQSGNKISLHGLKGKTVVLEWTNPECPFVRRHYREHTMEQLSAKFGSDVTWLAINSTHFQDAAVNKRWSDEQKLSYPVLSDQSGAVGKQYGAKTTPHMFVINSSGALVYEGAIDDDPHGENTTRKNYVDGALT